MQPLPYFLSHNNYKGLRKKNGPTDCSVALPAPTGSHRLVQHLHTRAHTSPPAPSTLVKNLRAMQYPATLKPQQTLHYRRAGGRREPELPRICIRPTLFMFQRKQTQLPTRESKRKVQPKT